MYFIVFQLIITIFITSCVSSNGSNEKTSLYSYNNHSYQRTNISVESIQRNFIWTPCDVMADAVINDLKMKAKSKGGDSIANILFEKDGVYISELPVCEKQLGWFFLYILPGLGPWVQVASAKAEVVRYSHSHTNPYISNKNESKSNTSNCASLVSGSKEKLVCGDSKDRVLEKWGNPTSASPTQGQWRYDLCVIEFLEGKLNNYGGKCDLSKISNDSFMGKRIEIAQMETQIKESHSDNVTNCLKVDVGETLQTTLSLMGKPIMISRNDVTLSNNKCFENFANPAFSLQCSDTIMTYLFTEHQNKLECKIYLKNKKIFYIDKNCPISCSLFE